MSEPRRGIGSRQGHWLWGLAADAAIFFITVWWGSLAILTILLTRRGWAADVFGRIWCRWILKVCGIGVDVEGAERFDPTRSYIVVANHLSNFDIWAAIAAVPLTVHFVAKKELLRLPVFGQALALSDHIVIDRSNPEEAIARINQRTANHTTSGFCILFFAEGTRSPDGKVQAFKKGGVTLGLRTGLPIVPMTISGTRKFLPKGRVVIRPRGRVKVVFGRPIETKDYPLERRDELNAEVRETIIANYVENY